MAFYTKETFQYDIDYGCFLSTTVRAILCCSTFPSHHFAVMTVETPNNVDDLLCSVGDQPTFAKLNQTTIEQYRQTRTKSQCAFFLSKLIASFIQVNFHCCRI